MLYRMIFPGLGILLIGVSYLLLQMSLRFHREGVHVMALVKDVEAGYDSGFYPIFEYEVDGVQYVNRHDRTSNRWKNKKGTHHEIVCDKNDPNKIKVISFWGLFLAPVATSCVAGVLLIITGWYYWYMYTLQ